MAVWLMTSITQPGLVKFKDAKGGLVVSLGVLNQIVMHIHFRIILVSIVF